MWPVATYSIFLRKSAFQTWRAIAAESARGKRVVPRLEAHQQEEEGPARRYEREEPVVRFDDCDRVARVAGIDACNELPLSLESQQFVSSGDRGIPATGEAGDHLPLSTLVLGAGSPPGEEYDAKTDRRWHFRRQD